MARRELLSLLDGRRVTELVPPRAGEPPSDYAVRATGELMIRYIAQDADDTAPS
jgi:hypothetical protein